MRPMMQRNAALAVLIAGAVLGACATQSVRPGAFADADQVLSTTLTRICMPHVFDGADMGAAAARGMYNRVDPKAIGSTAATEAWRIPSLAGGYVLRLPNNGCSIAVYSGDGAAMQEAALAMLGERVRFAKVDQETTRQGRAVRTSWCSPDAPPYVLSVVVGDNEPPFVLNLFKAARAETTLCGGA